MKQPSSTVQDLERKVQSLMDQLREAEKSLYDAKLDEIGMHPGDQVRLTGRKHLGELAKIDTIEFMSWGGKPWIRVFRYNKDGSSSQKSQQVMEDYEVEK